MATLKQRLHRKNASGTYDTVHLESESGMILRPNGHTVEADLASYLPEVQDSDTVPESLPFGTSTLAFKFHSKGLNHHNLQFLRMTHDLWRVA